MDNAGGNGKNEVVSEYSEYLAAKYKIVVHHQVPRSPKTNMIDLGASRNISPPQRQTTRFPRLVRQEEMALRGVTETHQNMETLS